ncbi:MAG: Dam family site-specific DNA-(adenine-N6)-methyltransferase [Planctomycetes bacterium]|nr:Dam family site-specific DNA-(adenine-N6)-methyltransferase [Planctomycetota bacterium]
MPASSRPSNVTTRRAESTLPARVWKSSRRTRPEAVQLTPPLKWAGGKRWLLPHLGPLWTPHRERRLVEPFCGGLAVALGLRPKFALLNDANTHAVNFYRWLQRGLRITLPMVKDRDFYYARREEFNALVTCGNAHTRRAAEIFYYLNRTGYNGLCRFNSEDRFNVPFGSYKTINYVSDFRPYRAQLARWSFLSTDFERVPLRPEDFVYADPPYDVDFRQYSKDGFHWPDQVRLAHWLAQHPGPVVASNQATDRILKLYHGLGFQLILLDGPRRISCTGDRTPAREMLATRGVAVTS